LPSCFVKNTPSTAEFGSDMADAVASWVKKGFASGPFKEPPLPNFRVNCFMAVNQGTKVRPILNISVPENSSFNDNVDVFELEKVTMCTARSFSYAVLAAGKGAKMYKSDVCDAYKIVPAKIEDLRLQGFGFLGAFFCENRMAFGGKPSVSNYDIVGNTLFTLAKVDSTIPTRLVDRCVDDVPVVSPESKNWGQEFTTNYKNLCKELNVELATNCPKFEKAFENATEGKVLGKVFNTVKQCWTLPTDKKEELLMEIQRMTYCKSNLEELQSLIGKLNDIGIMSPFLRNFRHELNKEMSNRYSDPCKMANLPNSAKRELNVWAGFLADEDIWYPIAHPENMPPITRITFTSDAAGLPHASCYKGHIGAASIGADSSDNLIGATRIWWPQTFISEKVDEKSVRFGDKTTTLEAIGLLLPFLSIPEKLVNKHILLKVDNMACVFGFGNNTCRGDKNAAIFIRALHLIQAVLGSRIYVEHLERRTDWLSEMADNMSRDRTTTELDRLTLSRFSTPCLSTDLQNWFRKPKQNWDLALDLMKFVKHKIE